jgi:hypothetical protein
MKLRHIVFGWLVFAILVGPGCTTSATKAEAKPTPEAASAPSGAAAATGTASSSPADADAPSSTSSIAAAAGAAQPAAAVNPTATMGIAATALTGAVNANSPAPATPAAVAPAAVAPAAVASATVAPAAAASAPNAAPAASAAAAAEASSPETIRKRALIEWALKQDEIKNDPHGQWAVEAKASSSYNDAQGTAHYSASQATGAPDVEAYGDNPSAWMPKTPNGGIEWLELRYAKPVHATAVRLRESCGSGAVIKVEVFDEQGAAHTVWSGVDPTKDLNYFTIEFPRTPYKASRLKVTLATNTVSGYKEIDAVQLVGTEQ